MTHQRFVLANGLRIILVPIKEVGSATTLCMVGAGSRYENRKNNGISHFLEHMAFKGTEKRPTAMEISTLIDGIGAEFNAFTDKEVTGYYIKSSSNHISLCLDVLSDMLSHPKLDSAELDKERGVILEELNLYEDTPMRKIGDIFEFLMYGDTPMGWDIGGMKDVIKKVDRQNFIDYMKNLYSADNMSVIVAGNIDPEKIKDQIIQYFGAFKDFKTINAQKVGEGNKKPEVLLKHKKTEQAHFALGVKSVGLVDEQNRFPLSILSSILGGGMSSRLFHEVREKRGLAYYVRTVSESHTDSGYLASFAGVDPKRIDEALKTVVEEYQKVTKDGEIAEKELEKAKQYVKGHFILELEDTRAVAAFYSMQEILERKLEDPEEVIKKIIAVSLDDVKRVALEFLYNKPLQLAIIGDFEDKNRFLKLIH